MFELFCISKSIHMVCIDTLNFGLLLQKKNVIDLRAFGERIKHTINSQGFLYLFFLVI